MSLCLYRKNTKNPETKNPETKKEKKVYEIIKRLCAVFLFGPKKHFFKFHLNKKNIPNKKKQIHKTKKTNVNKQTNISHAYK